MRTYLLLCTLLVLFLATACNDENITPTPNPVEADLDCTASPLACDLAAKNGDFAFKLLEKIHQDEPTENLFISPYSVSTAFGMVLNGAKGSTKDEMLDALEWAGFSIEEINAANHTLISNLPLLDNEVTFSISNSIWHEATFAVKQDFLDVNTNKYLSEVKAADFRDDATVGLINSWVNDKTNGKIETIIEEISPSEVMFLINALYFKGKWTQQFEVDNTQMMPFTQADGTTIQTETMNFPEKVTLPYHSNGQYRAVDLAYGDSIYSMTLIQPRYDLGYDLDGLVSELAQGGWEALTSGLTQEEIYVSLPKFKLEDKHTLNGYLVALGMEQAFTRGAADFTGIADADLNISKVLHKTYIEVDEAGTEAAAVTSIGIEVTSLPDNRAFFNQPFLFVIRDQKTNSVLFTGKLMDPSA